jgi:hypothetical protein
VREVHVRTRKPGFTALLHHVTVVRLQDSFYALKRDAVPVDGTTWREYETDLETRLTQLHGRQHRGTYRAQPSKRAYIPKTDGRQRPLGIAALEDKIVQHAVVMHTYPRRTTPMGTAPLRDQSIPAIPLEPDAPAIEQRATPRSVDTSH